MSHPPDSEILKLFDEKETQEKAFSLLVEKYQQQIYWTIRRIIVDHDDANDIVQNVFVKIFKNLKKFRKNSELYTWIYRIATNEALSFIKSSKKNLYVDNEYENHLLNEKGSMDPYFSGDEIQRKLQLAIQKLPPKQRLVFNMRYYEEIPYEKMSKILKTSEGALKASYHIAVRKIEKELGDDE